MAIDLYYTPGSAPCRIVLLVSASLGIEVNMKLVDLEKDDHLKPEFIKLNPQHTVPVVGDNGFILWESRAIARYLFNKYGGESTLYPKDPQLRAVVDQRMDFDIGTLYNRFAEYYVIASISTIDASGISLKKYPNVERWYELVKTTAPGYGEANQKDIDEYKKLLKKYLPS